MIPVCRWASCARSAQAAPAPLPLAGTPAGDSALPHSWRDTAHPGCCTCTASHVPVCRLSCRSIHADQGVAGSQIRHDAAHLMPNIHIASYPTHATWQSLLAACVLQLCLSVKILSCVVLWIMMWQPHAECTVSAQPWADINTQQLTEPRQATKLTSLFSSNIIVYD